MLVHTTSPVFEHVRSCNGSVFSKQTPAPGPGSGEPGDQRRRHHLHPIVPCRSPQQHACRQAHEVQVQELELELTTLIRIRGIEKFVFCLTGPYLTRRATIGRLELPLGRGRFVYDPPVRATPTSITANTARGIGEMTPRGRSTQVLRPRYFPKSTVSSICFVPGSIHSTSSSISPPPANCDSIFLVPSSCSAAGGTGSGWFETHEPCGAMLSSLWQPIKFG